MTPFNTKTDALLDDLLKNSESPEDLLGEHGLLNGLTKRLVKRALAVAQTNHLGSVPHTRHQPPNDNVHNGTNAKTVETDQGPMEVAVPHDRAGTVKPAVVKKWQRRLDGFDNQVFALYAHGDPRGKFNPI